jgi:hypothetical protein
MLVENLLGIYHKIEVNANLENNPNIHLLDLPRYARGAGFSY